MKRGTAVAAVGLLLAAVAGCAAVSGTPSSRVLHVHAAMSLADVFSDLAKRFEKRHHREHASVITSFGSSAAVAEQIVQGAPAGVFAAANPETMETVTEAGLGADEPSVFVRNRLEIAVPAGNPDKVRTLADLARPGMKVALCAVQVPCGAAAATALKAAGVTVEPDTYERHVRAVMTKLVSGEVDAALVYHTDVVAFEDHDVAGVEFPEAADVVNDYQITTLKDAADPKLAAEFVAFVRSDVGRAALSKAGFEVP
ncbi:MAG: molybdate ABC transporter substrate-binding protein [Micromonosporaceae bacterium]